MDFRAGSDVAVDTIKIPFAEEHKLEQLGKRSTLSNVEVEKRTSQNDNFDAGSEATGLIEHLQINDTQSQDHENVYELQKSSANMHQHIPGEWPEPS